MHQLDCYHDQLLTFTLLLPLLNSFYILSHIIYGMAIVSYSFLANAAHLRQKIKKFRNENISISDLSKSVRIL